jgi:uncharacterized protein (UPF0332 family)
VFCRSSKPFQSELYEGSVNRSYYAIIYSLRAILALDGVDFKTHSAVIGYFRKEYIKTGVFDKAISIYIGEPFDIRNDSDYEDYYEVTRQNAETQLL